MITRVHRALRTEFLPYALPWIGEEEIDEVVDTLRSGWLTTGPKVLRFEQEFAAFVGARHAVAVQANTFGLHLSLLTAGVGPGDEVIVPTLTFAATANEVVHVGARPVLVDSGGDFNMDPAAVAAAITPRTKAVIPVHFGGQPADLDAIGAIAERQGAVVIEDAAHAVGTAYRGREVGTISRATVFSFYATKNLTTGEGGMITVGDDRLAARLRQLASHGMSRDAWKRYSSAGSWYYEIVEPGYKYNMSDMQASLGLHQLRRLRAFHRRRAQIAERYNEAFASLPLDLPICHPDRSHNWHLYVVRLRLEALAIGRNRFIEELKRRRIGTAVHYVPLHMQPFYRERYGYRSAELPRAAAFFERMISLPLYPRMSDDDVEDTIDAVGEICQKFRRW